MAEEGSVAPAPVSEPMDLMDALHKVLKKALVKDGLCRGLREVAKALDRRDALFCVLAEDCDHDGYRNLIRALCKEHNIPLLSVPTQKELATMAGIATVGDSGNVLRTARCSSVVVKVIDKDDPNATFVMNECQKIGKAE
uniref:40S ribosomal protein S12 n=1 Tax=Stygiella incarcerata TaxID=1712417 RepID=A0A192ZI60_9EUKA|nr:40S ribosomal protein S12 [Stygiella incarcerata]